jgi:hypothetical protein
MPRDELLANPTANRVSEPVTHNARRPKLAACPETYGIERPTSARPSPLDQATYSKMAISTCSTVRHGPRGLTGRS